MFGPILSKFLVNLEINDYLGTGFELFKNSMKVDISHKFLIKAACLFSLFTFYMSRILGIDSALSVAEYLDYHLLCVPWESEKNYNL